MARWHAGRDASRVGTRLPAPTTSTGKTLLAASSPAELDVRLAAWTPVRTTPYSIVDPGVLRARLAEVAARGWAENREESRVGVVSVAAPIRDRTAAVIAAMSVAAPTDRAGPAALRRIRTSVVDAAAVTRALPADRSVRPRWSRPAWANTPVVVSRRGWQAWWGRMAV